MKKEPQPQPRPQAPATEDAASEVEYPPEVEEELAALCRPTSAEELFGTGTVSPERAQRAMERVRDLLARQGRTSASPPAAERRSS